MENEFDNVMQKRSDADLIKILSGPPDDYQPIALNAAKREFERRNLSDIQIATAKQQIIQKQQIDQTRADMPLGTLPKIFAFLFPGILLLASAGIFKADGYDRKAKELTRYTLYGFGFYVFFVLVNVLRFVI